VPGTRALSLFLVNERPEGDRRHADAQFVFQVRLELEFKHGFLPRPNRRDEASLEWDERVADLQFRARCEFAVGHGVSTAVPDCTEPVRRVRTTWLPRAEVYRVETRDEPAVTTSVEALAALQDGPTTRRALSPQPELYYDPRSVEQAAHASMHAKFVVVDERFTLITSANFTGRGQSRNVEVGVLIDDSAFAVWVLEQWRGLVAAGLVERYTRR
jgi:phosphatidylserine/phosphatidylglycerophosphate/cardiolipin synthase-like enzyme